MLGAYRCFTIILENIKQSLLLTTVLYSSFSELQHFSHIISSSLSLIPNIYRILLFHNSESTNLPITFFRFI